MIIWTIFVDSFIDKFSENCSRNSVRSEAGRGEKLKVWCGGREEVGFSFLSTRVCAVRTT